MGMALSSMVHGTLLAIESRCHHHKLEPDDVLNGDGAMDALRLATFRNDLLAFQQYLDELITSREAGRRLQRAHATSFLAVYMLIVGVVDTLGDDDAVCLRIVRLINELAVLDQAESDDSRAREIDQAAEPPPQALPNLGQFLIQNCFSLQRDNELVHPQDILSWSKLAPRFSRTMMFAATYYVHGNIGSIKTLTMDEAKTVFVNALEAAVDNDVRLASALLFIPAAVNWIGVAGIDIYQLCIGQLRDESPETGQSRLFDPELMETVWTPAAPAVFFSLPRWRFWQQRCLELSDAAGIPPLTQSLLFDAARRMEAIDAVGQPY